MMYNLNRIKSKKLSLRQTVNEVLCDFNIEEEDSSGDENSALWIDAIQKCLENNRRNRMRVIKVPSEVFNVIESSDSSMDSPRRASNQCLQSSVNHGAELCSALSITQSPYKRLSPKYSPRRSSTKTPSTTSIAKHSSTRSLSEHHTPRSSKSCSSNKSSSRSSSKSPIKHSSTKFLFRPPSIKSSKLRRSTGKASNVVVELVSNIPYSSDNNISQRELDKAGFSQDGQDPSFTALPEEINFDNPALSSTLDYSSSHQISSSGALVNSKSLSPHQTNFSDPSLSEHESSHSANLHVDLEHISSHLINSHRPSVTSESSFSQDVHSPVPSDYSANSPTHSDSSSQFLKANTIRRSKRIRLPPLEFWRGQRPIYRPREDGTYEFVCIENGTSPYKRKRARVTRKTKVRKLFDLSCHVPLSESFIENSDKARKELEGLITREKLKWNQFKNSDVFLVKVHSDSTRSRGYIKILGKGEKPLQTTGSYESEFTLLSGKVSVTIGSEKPVILESFESFSVGPHCSYSIKNLRDEEAFFSFYVFT